MPLFTVSPYRPPIPKTSDQDVVSSTALVDDDKLTFPVLAGEVIILEFYLYVTFSAAGQIKVAIDGPAANFFLVTAEMVSNGITVATGVTSMQDDPISLVNASATSGLVKVTAVCAFSADGDVVLRFAQNVSDVTPTRVKGGSYLRVNTLPTN